jgi:hypothetical protein
MNVDHGSYRRYGQGTARHALVWKPGCDDIVAVLVLAALYVGV